MEIVALLRRAYGLIWQLGKWWLIGAVLFMIVIGLLPFASLFVMKELINAVTVFLQDPSVGPSTVWWLLGLQFALAVARSTFDNLNRLLDAGIRVKLDYHLQKRIAEKTSSVSLAHFDLPDFYHHLNRVGQGPGDRFLQPARALLDTGAALLRVFSFLGFLLTVHWGLVLISLLAAVPMLVMQSRMGRSRFRMMYHQTPRAREAAYLFRLLTDRDGAKEVRLFGLGGYLIGRWSDKFLHNAKEYLRLTTRQKSVEIGLDGSTAFFYGAASLLIVWLAGTRRFGVGDFVAIGSAVQGTQSAVNEVAGNLASIYEQGLYLRDLFGFLDFEEPELTRKEPEVWQSLPERLEQGIVFEKVSFRYVRSPRDTLRQVSFAIKPGEKVAIVGENGSGKTTLVKCLMGLYNVTGGRITFDGRDLAEVKERDLRRAVTVILQDFMKYAFTVRENIEFGDIERAGDVERVERVGRESGVAAFAERFEKGYDTALGRLLQQGEDLSGGQWQKVAIARALFRDGQVIVLDEPTAALDPQAEMEVFRRFRDLARDKTAVLISHRMAAARLADRILVMKEGELVESGTHRELIALGGEYARMYGMQAQWYAEGTSLLEEEVAAGWRK